MSRSLAAALGLLDTAVSPLVAFVGAGGKTSLIFALAAQLPGKVIVTTTTHIARAQIQDAVRALPAKVCRYPDLSALDQARVGIFLVVGPDVDAERVGGVPPQEPQSWLARGDVTAVLVEADGARLLPVKAPAAHEPAMPAGATLVVPVAGIDAIGRPIAAVAHRPTLVAKLLRRPQDSPLTPADLAALLAHPDGGLKAVPRAARIIPVLNKVQDDRELVAARQAANLILHHPRPQRVLLTAANTEVPLREVVGRVTAVVLAAGEARRMGRLKQLLSWGETTLLGQTLVMLGQTAVYDTVVVTGAEAQAVGKVARAGGARTVHNPDFERGEMISSLQTAVRRLPAHVEGVLVVLADQPLVEAEMVDRLLSAFWQERGDLIAPVYGGQRGNPVLIGRTHFPELLALPVGSAPRDLLRRHEVFLVPAPSAAVLQDIDTITDYQRLRPG